MEIVAIVVSCVVTLIVALAKLADREIQRRLTQVESDVKIVSQRQHSQDLVLSKIEAELEAIVSRLARVEAGVERVLNKLLGKE